jgi:hypothetical protein
MKTIYKRNAVFSIITVVSEKLNKITLLRNLQIKKRMKTRSIEDFYYSPQQAAF